MSDTPRTDAAASSRWLDAATRKEMVEANFARSLERENARLEKQLDRLTEWYEEAESTNGLLRHKISKLRALGNDLALAIRRDDDSKHAALAAWDDLSNDQGHL